MQPTRRQVLGGAGASLVLGSLGCSIFGRDGGRKDLIQRQENPFNAEPRLDHLIRSWVTPHRYFFVRSHGRVPEVDPATYALTVEGSVDRAVQFSLGSLEKFPQVPLSATIQCAENRRSEHGRFKPVEGIPWDAGAIGTAEWRGVRVADLLALAGVKPAARYVWFEGLDAVALPDRQTVFGSQVPLERAMQPETIVALEMNGRPLSGEHGYPARAVVPGCIGACSVKWLGRIVVAEKKSDNYFVAREFKLFPPEVPAEKIKPEEFEPVTDTLLNSVIALPLVGQIVEAGRLQVRGFAIPPGIPGVTVAGVEVSPDGGASWAPATLTGKDAPFAWKFWAAEVAVAPGARTLIARATDSKGAAQPEQPARNSKGYLYNGWHRVPITVA